MLIPHQFDPETHIYKVPGEYVLATSDVIELNGMSEFGQVPPANLDFASHRGSAVHVAIHALETGCDWEDAVRGYEAENGCEVFETVCRRMAGYFRFRKSHSIRLAGQMERTMVYRHLGTDALIGATPDFPCYIDDVFTILDPKTVHKQYGEKAKQLKLKWWAQLQSYLEAYEQDDEFWKTTVRPDQIQKAILHLHPECGKERGCKPLEYEFHVFPGDAQFLWDSMIRIAEHKLRFGYKLTRNVTAQEVPVKFANAGYQKPEDCEF